MSKQLFEEQQEREIAQVETGLSMELKSLIQADKAQIEDISKAIVQRVADGDLDPFKAYCHVKKIKDLADSVEKNLRPHINSKGIQKGGLTMFNIEFTGKSNPATWDYSGCNDPEYDKLLSELEAVEGKIKKREKVLQNMDKPEEKVDTETGETYTVYPAVKTTGAENFAAKLK